MKYYIILILIILMPPLFAGVNCMDNSEHLEKSNDHKELHAIACDCKCEVIKSGVCTECGHVQNARPLTVIESSRTKKVVVKQFAIQIPKNLQDFINNSVKPYLQNAQ